MKSSPNNRSSETKFNDDDKNDHVHDDDVDDGDDDHDDDDDDHNDIDDDGVNGSTNIIKSSFESFFLLPISYFINVIK